MPREDWRHSSSIHLVDRRSDCGSSWRRAMRFPTEKRGAFLESVAARGSGGGRSRCDAAHGEVSEDCGHHCALRPRALINCSMFLTSSAASLLISCGVLLATMLPFSVNFAISSGVWEAITNSR